MFCVCFHSRSQTKCSKDGIRPYAGYLEQGFRIIISQKHIIFIQFFGFLLVGSVALKKSVRASV
jgi:hypothetical protein